MGREGVDGERRGGWGERKKVEAHRIDKKGNNVCSILINKETSLEELF